jgi:hypothetical protein
MALFVALHQHQADRCPAADPQMGSMLLRHLSPENALGQGVTIQLKEPARTVGAWIGWARTCCCWHWRLAGAGLCGSS